MDKILSLQEAKDQIAQSKGFKDRDDMGARANWMEKDANEAAELFCQSQKAQAWEECSERWKDTINDEYNWPEPVNPYLETKKD